MKTLTNKTLLLLMIAFGFSFTSNAYAGKRAHNYCENKTYSYDPIVAAVSRLECLIPIAKDTVGDQARIDVFGELLRSVRTASRQIDIQRTVIDPDVQSAVAEVVVNFCSVYDKLEDLEEADNRAHIMDGILTAGVQIMALTGKNCN